VASRLADVCPVVSSEQALVGSAQTVDGHRVEPRRCGASPADRRRPAAEKASVNARYRGDVLVGTVPQPTKLRLALVERGAVANLTGTDP